MADESTSSISTITASDIADAAANPHSFSVEGLSQTNRPISDLIAADKYLRKRRLASARANPLSLITSHVIPPAP